MITSIDSPINRNFILPINTERELKNYRVLLGEKGSKKKKQAVEKLKAEKLDMGKDGKTLWATSALQHLRALSNHKTALGILNELDLGVDYIPIITSEVYWGDVLEKAIPDLKIEEIILPVPECYFKFKYSDGKYYVVYLKQTSESEEIDFKPFRFYEPSLTTHSLYGNMTDDMILYVFYLLLSFEIKVSKLVASNATEICFQEDHPRRSIDPSVEYKLSPIRKTVGAESNNEGVGSKKKFHIRRAHWRTYESGKRIRIGWMFVGDISLGFVDKDYVV